MKNYLKFVKIIAFICIVTFAILAAIAETVVATLAFTGCLAISFYVLTQIVKFENKL